MVFWIFMKTAASEDSRSQTCTDHQERERECLQRVKDFNFILAAGTIVEPLLLQW